MSTMKTPTTAQELLQKAQQLAGLSLGMIASQLQLKVPDNLLNNKGWVGQLIENALGGQAASRPMPDFPLLGIELKTIPVTNSGHVLESTFICTVPLLELSSLTWKTSPVWMKLARVLWVPVEADKTIPLVNRRIGAPMLWSPNQQQEIILHEDWHELTSMICLGQLENITAKHGTYLQIRPKAANSRMLCPGIGEDGQRIMTLPRGFYLRAKFTQEILQQRYTLRLSS